MSKKTAQQEWQQYVQTDNGDADDANDDDNGM